MESLHASHWLNSFLLLYFKHEYIRPLHLLIVLFQMLVIPWSWQFPPIQRFQVIASLLGIMGDSVGSFLGWAELPLSWVLGGSCDFVQDEISNIKLFELHSSIAILGYLLLVLCHLA